MAWSYVGAGAVGYTVVNNGTQQVTLTLPSGTSTGDLLVVMIASNTAITGGVPNGWNVIYYNPTGGNNFHAFFKFAAAGETSLVLSIASTRTAGQMFAYRGPTAFDALSTKVQISSGNTITTNSLTSSNTNDLVISLYGNNGQNGGASNMVAPANTNVRALVNSTGAPINGFMVVDETSASTTSTQRTATLNNSQQNQQSAGAISVSFTDTGSPVIVGTNNMFLMF